jgi:hypothetical protein
MTLALGVLVAKGLVSVNAECPMPNAKSAELLPHPAHWALGIRHWALTAAPAEPATYLVIIVGLAGDPEHGELFRKWGAALVDVASGRLGVSRDRVVYLADEPPADAARVAGRSTRAEIERAFDALSKKTTEDDVVFVVLIGHGTFDGREAKFNLPGPDMGPPEFAKLVGRLPPKHVVFVNTASASGPFLAALSAPGRTIVTATRTGSERFATLFGGYFIDAFAGDAADADKNRRISVLEAFTYARREVARAYEREGLMATEHALLDDDGNREGAAEPSAEAPDGRVAAVLSLGAASDADPLPAPPRLRALYTERRELERRVEALKLLKGGMDPARYASELEKLLTDLALKSREIRQVEGKEQ